MSKLKDKAQAVKRSAEKLREKKEKGRVVSGGEKTEK